MQIPDQKAFALKGRRPRRTKAASYRHLVHREQLAGRFQTAMQDLTEAQRIAKLGVWHWIVGTQKFEWSDELYRIAGRDPSGFHVTLDSTFACIHPDDRQPTFDRLMEAVRDKANYGREFRFVRPDGEERHCWAEVRPILDTNGTVISVRGICQDIGARKKIEQALRDSEEFNRRVLGASEDCIKVLSLDGRVEFLSAGGMCVMEVDDFSLVRGGCWLEFWSGGDKARAEEAMEAARAGGVGRFQGFCPTLKGTPKSWDVIVTPIMDAHGQPEKLLSISRDITQLKAAEQALRESEEHYRYTVELNPQMPWTADPDGNILEVSSRWLEFTGMTREEMLGHGWMGAIHPDDVGQISELWSTALATAAPVDLRYRLRLHDGSYKWFQARASARCAEDGRIIRWYGILEDIGPQVEAEQRLRAAEERYRLATRATNDLIWDWDLQTGQVLWNDALHEGYGYSTEQLGTTDQWWQDRVHPGDRNRVLSDIARFTAGDSQQLAIQYRFRKADGSYAEVCDRCIIVREGGRPVRIVGAMQDLTERRRAELALQESEALNRSIVEASPYGIKLLDLDSKLLFMNEASGSALEVDDPSGLYGKPWVSLWPEEARPLVEDALAAARAGGIGRFSAARPTMSGSLKWWDVVVSPVVDGDGRSLKLVGISRDITQQKTAEERLRWGATHDALTGLPNRVGFHQHLAEAIAAAEAAGRSVGVLHLDVDHFKQINDTFGHDAGDELLKTFAERLRAALRSGDIAARLGGDEFAIVLPNLASDQDIPLIVDAVQSRMRLPFLHAGQMVDCRASIGASIYPMHGRSPGELLKHADVALYMVKAAGRGGFRVFDADMQAGLDQRSLMIARAREALSDDQIAPFYQPQVELATNRIAGFEALLRWRHPTKGLLRPRDMAAAFDDVETAAAISDRQVSQAISDMRRWLDHGVDFGHVAVNASEAEFRYDNFAERVLDELRRAGVPAKFLHLEVTEKVFLGRGNEFVGRALQLLAAEQVTIALDDFGTGYASLKHLKQFPVSTIKIDQGFVKDMEVNASDEAIVRTIISLGKSLDIKVVAEGIERRSQANHLRRLGCDYGQGYLFSRAVPAGRVPTLISCSQAFSASAG